jgi:hypothetical protein
MLIRSVFLLRQPAPHTAFCGFAVLGTNKREARQNGMAGSGAPPPVDIGSFGEGSEPSRQEAAEYIASLLDGLRRVAHESQLPFLAYLISVALEEANIEKSRRD